MENVTNFDLKMDAADELENVGDPEEIFNNLIEWDDIPDAVLWQALTELDVEEAAPVPPSADDEPQQAPPKTDTKSSFVKLSEEELNKIEEGKDEKTTKQTTAWGVKRFKSK